MAEPHLDRDMAGQVKWFKGEGALPVLGPCPHTRCEHFGQGVIAWGPSLERYELVECGLPGEDNCGRQCRAWTDGRHRATTPWMQVDLNQPVVAGDPWTGRV